MKKITKILLFAIIFLTSKSIIKAADYIWPIDEKNAYETYIEYGYGQRTYDSKAYDSKYNYGQLEAFYSRYENHYGVDITGIKGQTYDVISIVDGTVLTTSLDQLYNPSLSYPDRNQRNVSFDGGGYGNYIVIKEDKTGKCFLYAHLKANSVTLRNGQKVTKGQKIGVMGSSGDSGHMHLHFEVRLNQQYTTTGKNLVITRTYGVETLDPTKFIGTKAPEKKVVETKLEIKEQTNIVKPEVKEKEDLIDNKQEIKPIETKTTNVEFTDYGTFGKITVTLSTTATETPQVNVIIGDETKYANFISRAGNTCTYTIKYDDFNVITYGNIKIDVNTKEHYSKVVGYLNEYKIPQTYEDSYYYRLGDLNKDGYVDAVDASLTLNLYSKLATDQTLTKEEQDQKTRADMNKDGYVNSIDASLILSYYANNSTSWTNSKQEKIITCDISNNHVVDSYDYYLLNTAVKSNKYDTKYDLNKDGVVNNQDKSFFMQTLKEFGKR